MDKLKFGTATAAFQCEGNLETNGRGKCIWDDVLLNNKSIAKYSPEPASEFYTKYDVDFELGKEYGIEVMRISLPWSRIFPNNEKDVNLKAVEDYHKMFKNMLEKGIEPNITLHHFDSPQWFVEKGDFLSKENVDHFVNYAEFCFKEFKEIKYWATLNEINAYAEQKNIKAALPPYFKLEYGQFVKQQYNMVVAHARVVNLFKKMKVNGLIGIPCSICPFESIDNKPENILAAKRANSVQNWAFLEPVALGYYTDETLKLINSVLENYDFIFKPQSNDIEIIKEARENLDWIGINYYFTNFVEKAGEKVEVSWNTTGEKGNSKFNLPWLWKVVSKPGVKTTHWDWNIYPQGLKTVVEWITEKYGYDTKPIFITENGFGDLEDIKKTPFIEDFERIQYVQDHFDVIEELRDKGKRIEHYYLWSHMDMFSWTNGYNKRYGLFYVDFETQERTEKLSAYWWKEKTLQNRLDEKVNLKELRNKINK